MMRGLAQAEGGGDEILGAGRTGGIEGKSKNDAVGAARVRELGRDSPADLLPFPGEETEKVEVAGRRSPALGPDAGESGPDLRLFNRERIFDRPDPLMEGTLAVSDLRHSDKA